MGERVSMSQTHLRNLVLDETLRDIQVFELPFCPSIYSLECFTTFLKLFHQLRIL